MKIERLFISIFLAIMLGGCDPIYSIKRNVTFDGTISSECIVDSAKSLGNDTQVRKVEDEYGPRDFDEYIVSDGKAGIDVLWYRSNRQLIEIGTLGIGYADKERDAAICSLVESFYKALLIKCAINSNTVSIKNEYVRSECP